MSCGPDFCVKNYLGEKRKYFFVDFINLYVYDKMGSKATLAVEHKEGKRKQMSFFENIK